MLRGIEADYQFLLKFFSMLAAHTAVFVSIRALGRCTQPLDYPALTDLMTNDRMVSRCTHAMWMATALCILSVLTDQFSPVYRGRARRRHFLSFEPKSEGVRDRLSLSFAYDSRRHLVGGADSPKPLVVFESPMSYSQAERRLLWFVTSRRRRVPGIPDPSPTEGSIRYCLPARVARIPLRLSQARVVWVQTNSAILLPSPCKDILLRRVKTDLPR
jgi:hypothetical protein